MSTPAEQERGGRRALPLLLVAATLLCYGALLLSGDNEFVYDDIRFIQKNPAVHDLSGFASYFTDPRTVEPDNWAGIYRPLRTLDFAIDWALFGPSPWWFHLRNVVYLALGVLLVFSLLKRWRAPEPAAALGSLVFALHPVQVESVAWITSRGDLLCLLFFLLAMILHQGDDRYGRRFLGANLALAAALLSKETAVMFPAAAFLADFFFRDDLELKTTLRRWPRYLVYLVLALLYSALWMHLHSRFGEEYWHISTRWGGSLVGSVLTMSRGFVYYMRLILLPVDMAQDWYMRPVSSPDPLTIVCLVGIAGLLAWSVWRMFRGGGALAFAVLWGFLLVFPASNLPGPIGITTAERFLLLPMVGVSFGAGLLLHRVARASFAGRALVGATLVCLLLVSAERSLVWVSERALWTTTLHRCETPRGLDWMAEMLRYEGEALRERERDLRDSDRIRDADAVREQARRKFEESIALSDRQIELWSVMPAPGAAIAIARAGRAIGLHGLGRYDEMLQEARRVVEAWEALPSGHFALALAYYSTGDYRNAHLEIDRALELEDLNLYRRNGAAIYEKLAEWYNERGNRARTYQSLKRSWELLPSEDRNRAVRDALEKLEAEYARLVAPLTEAVERDPEDAWSWLELAKVHSIFGNPQGRELFESLLRNERPPEVLFFFAYYWWEWKDTKEGYEEAEKLYREAIEKRTDFPEAQEGLERCRRELSKYR